MLATSDGGYIFGGLSFSGSSGDRTQASQGDADCWVVRIDADGNKLWDKRFGGSGGDYLSSMVSTGDGGYLQKLCGVIDSKSKGLIFHLFCC